MTSPLSDEKLMELLKGVYETTTASPDFKEHLRQRLSEEAATHRTPAPKPLWRQPLVWGPAAAAVAMAMVLVIVLVAVPALSPRAFGTLQVIVTDVKGQEPVVTAIEVAFDNVLVHRSAHAGDSNGGWIVLAGNLNKTVDLLKLSDIEEILGEDEIEAGHYQQIRVGVVKVRITVNGVSQVVGLEPTGDAEIAPGELKFVGNFEVKADQTTIVTIDFDLSKGNYLVSTGEGKWIFKPTIKLVIASPSD